MKLVAVADPHVGGARFGVTDDQWESPLVEAVQYAIRERVQLFVIPGDLFHRRNPSTQEYHRAMMLLSELTAAGIEVLVVDGNHDVGAAGDAIPATWPLALAGCKTMSGPAGRQAVAGVDVICLPWPRPVDYLTDQDDLWSLADEIGSTRVAVLKRLRELCLTGKDLSVPRILVGHAMVSYGTVTPNDPGLLLGKDVVIPYEDLRSLPGVAAVLLGHVHNPASEGYIGSTQPTDFGEAEQIKTFTVIEIDDNGQLHRQRIPYKTSLKLWDCEWHWTEDEDEDLAEILDQAYGEACDRQGLDADTSFDAARLRLIVPPGRQVDPAEARRLMQRYAGRVVSVEIVRPDLMQRRVAATEGAIAKLTPEAAFDRWLQERKVLDGEAESARNAFREARGLNSEIEPEKLSPSVP